jgi:TPR repeat protein/secreted trypsin-like serine protease
MGKGRGIRKSGLLAMLAMLATFSAPVAATPADAQSAQATPDQIVAAPPPPAIPRRFGTADGPRRAARDKPPALVAREEAAASAAEARCAGGEAGGCAALGRAFLFGEGKPQNRFVAEILLKEACEQGAAEGCGTLGEFLASTRRPDLRSEGLELLRRGCELGGLDACAGLADQIEQGTGLGDGDAAAAQAVRRPACDKGGVLACTALYTDQMLSPAAPAEEDAAIAGLQRLCRAGTRAACRALYERFGRLQGAQGNPFQRGVLEDGCKAGLGLACGELGRSAYATATGLPENRSAALALFDRACDADGTDCHTAKAIRARGLLAVACEAGDQAACAELGDLYVDFNSLLYDAAEALRLHGGACDAGIITACRDAADTLIGPAQPLAPEDAARAIRWLTRACDAEDAMACESLGEELVRGEAIPAERARGFELISLACERGRQIACNALEEASQDDPDAPYPPADARIQPPMSGAEQEAFYDRMSQERRARIEADRANDCTTTVVEFRGVTYEDTLCDNVQRVTGGYIAAFGEAPWQALIWRPAVLGTLRPKGAERVQCGGALVRRGWILTAAHCLQDEAEKGVFFDITKYPYRVRLGVSNPLRPDEGISYPIKQVIAHRNFRRAGFAFDIALIEYDPAAGQRGSSVGPIRQIRLDDKPLEARTIVARAPAYVFGWGRTAYEGRSEAPDALRGARLELRDTDSCTRLTGLRDVRMNSVLCGAGARGEQACFGDSGGPLITYADASKAPTVIGVVSAGVKCGSTGKPSRFTRIGHPEVQRWLTEKLPGYRPASARR